METVKYNDLDAWISSHTTPGVFDIAIDASDTTLSEFNGLLDLQNQQVIQSNFSKKLATITDGVLLNLTLDLPLSIDDNITMSAIVSGTIGSSGPVFLKCIKSFNFSMENLVKAKPGLGLACFCETENINFKLNTIPAEMGNEGLSPADTPVFIMSVDVKSATIQTKSMASNKILDNVMFGPNINSISYLGNWDKNIAFSELPNSVTSIDLSGLKDITFPDGFYFKKVINNIVFGENIVINNSLSEYFGLCENVKSLSLKNVKINDPTGKGLQSMAWPKSDVGTPYDNFGITEVTLDHITFATSSEENIREAFGHHCFGLKKINASMDFPLIAKKDSESTSPVQTFTFCPIKTIVVTDATNDEQLAKAKQDWMDRKTNLGLEGFENIVFEYPLPKERYIYTFVREA